MMGTCHYISKPIECIAPRANLNVKYDFVWLWCVNLGSSIVTNVPLVRLWCGMLIMGEAIHVGEQEEYKEALYLSLNYVVNLKESLNSKKKKKIGRDHLRLKELRVYSKALGHKWHKGSFHCKILFRRQRSAFGGPVASSHLCFGYIKLWNNYCPFNNIFL